MGFGGGEIKKLSTNPNSNNTGIKITGTSINVEITELTITNFRNKGIDIGGESWNIKVNNNTILGAGDGNYSTDNPGISIYESGTNVIKLCIIDSNYVYNSRIGITVNGSVQNTVTNNHITASRDSGIALYGVVSETGDGAKNCIVANNVIDGVAATSWTGIYLRNGASKNIITGNSIYGSSGCGIRYSGGTWGISVYNVISSNYIEQSISHGINTSYMDKSIISDNELNTYGGHGIFLFLSDNNSVNSNYIFGSDLTDQKGIRLQGSIDNWINDNVSTNNKYGLGTDYYSTTVPDNNVAENNDFSGNITAAVTLSGTNTILNNRGYNPPEIISQPTGTSAITIDTSARIWYISSAIVTINFPSVSGNKNVIYTIVNITNAHRNTSTYLNFSGYSTTTIAANYSITIISDGGNWRQIQ